VKYAQLPLTPLTSIRQPRLEWVTALLAMFDRIAHPELEGATSGTFR
jgi:hypothetical protein